MTKKFYHPVPATDKKRLLAKYQQAEYQSVIDSVHILTRQYSLSAYIWNLVGACHKALGSLESATHAYYEAIKIQPDYADSFYNLGVVNNLQSDYPAAIENYKQAIVLKPDHAEAYNNLGNIFYQQGDFSSALKNYQKSLGLCPDNIKALYNLGVVLQSLGDLTAAADTFRQLLTINPNFFEAHKSLGNVLLKQGQALSARKCFEQTLSIQPKHAQAHYNLGLALSDSGELEAAVRSHTRALDIQPDYVKALGSKIFQQAHMCDWSMPAQELLQILSTCGIHSAAVPPFILLALEDNPQRQHQRAMTWATERYQQVAPALPNKPKKIPAKIRIGYFSSDFHDHPMLYLMSGLFKYHDKERFEIYAYNYGAKSTSSLCNRVRQHVDGFFDIQQLKDHDVMQLARLHQLDIALDRKGYTQNSRSELFSYRLAPVQINYLAYPSTMGAPFIDYLVADKTIIPASQHRHYSESIIILPDTYQPNDDRRKIASTTTARADFGLPDNAFVFCCFNNSYKIRPAEFAIWMRLLKRIDKSVLWLLRSNQWVEINLRREAEKHGIDGGRLVFADKLSHAEHLARHKHANLFMDTFNYNAHTTTSDALWSGLPVITKAGSQFAARVSASLLHAVGLPELITDSEADYEALAFVLASDPNRLTAITTKLAKQRLIEPLFNTKRYTRHLEEAYQQVYERYYDGLDPIDIEI